MTQEFSVKIDERGALYSVEQQSVVFIIPLKIIQQITHVKGFHTLAQR